MGFKKMMKSRLRVWDACECARKDPSRHNIREQQRLVMCHGSAEHALAFAQIPGADIRPLQDMVIRTGNASDAYDFARFIPGADVDTLYRVAKDYDFAGLEKDEVQDFEQMYQESEDEDFSAAPGM
jgi:hypothetical protein